MIITRLSGGLGNQMFQYAAGKALAVRHGAKLVLDLSWFGTQNLRSYELDCFVQDTPAATQADLDLIISSRLKPILPVANAFGFLKKRIPLILEPHFHYWRGWTSIGSPAAISGYWQSEHYFHDSAEAIRRDFAFADQPTGNNLRNHEKISGTDCSVSIHIRRGDYVSNPTTNQEHGTCSSDYYAKAIDFVAARIGTPHFFIFSDDISWVKSNFRPGNHPYTLIDGNDADSGCMDMLLMAACRHHIIANSSFSWWGAWLTEQKDSIVCAPTNWFRQQSHDTRDIIPSRWHRM